VEGQTDSPNGLGRRPVVKKRGDGIKVPGWRTAASSCGLEETRCHFDPLPVRGRLSYILAQYRRDDRSWPHRSRHEHYDRLGVHGKKDATNGVRSYLVPR
jgi:hypothetical protein